MDYRYIDLGHRTAGIPFSVHLAGQANVMLLDNHNYNLYRAGSAYRGYYKGYYKKTPIPMRIPSSGRWYVVADLGGYGGRIGDTFSIWTAARW